jgi:molecular chaperone DnaK (HSP70)
MKMKEIAEQKIGEEIRDVVVTVPAYFTEKQKKATQEAALLAGLYPRQLIPEPTAAAICYCVDQSEEERKVYLVYDLGGGTFDVSIIAMEEEDIQVVATSGDPRLGGGDFDDAITDWAVEELKQQHNIDVSADQSAKARIKSLAEQAKVILSTHMSTSLNLAELFPQQAPTLTLEREKFESLIEAILKKSITYIDMAIEGAEKKGVQRDDIDAILLVGGSSKIPKIKDQLLDYFRKDDSFVRSELNPDEVVARGAAILANRYQPSPAPFDVSKEIDNTLINEDIEDDLNVQLITEHSLGVEVQDKVFSKIIDQGRNIPIEIKQEGYTNGGPTDDIEVRVYQGEGQNIFENTLIGILHLGPMEPKPAGQHQFEVTFKLDKNGLLSMVVHHINEGKNYEAHFDQKTGVGGDAALTPLRNKLLGLYADRSALATVAPSTTTAATTQTGPPPPSQPTPTEPSSYTPPPPSPAEQPTPAPQVAQPQTQSPPQPSLPSVETHPPHPVPDSKPVSSDGAIVEPTVDVPAEFKSIVRRARKKLLKTLNPDLLNAFNAFTNALNAGTPEDELEELGDALGDIYHDTPDGPTIIEPAVEVPAQFKSIVRRAHKQLLKELHLELLGAFNAFTSALNAGTPEDDLEKLGDTLDDIYHDTRK